MGRRFLFRVFAILCAIFVLSTILTFVMFEKSCDMPVTNRYFWLDEDVKQLYTDESALKHIPHKPLRAVDYPWLSDSMLARAVSKQEHSQLLTLARTVVSLLEAYNVTYMMSYGTLLGSYVFGDVIPWDDDMDIIMDSRDIPKVQALFRNEAIRREFLVNAFGDAENMWDTSKMWLEHASNGLNLDIILAKVERNLLKSGIPAAKRDTIIKQVKQEHSVCVAWRKQVPRFYKAKFSPVNAERAGAFDWTWPFVDLIFYEDIGDSICSLDYESFRMCQKKSDTFPLTRRPLGNLWLPAPRDSRTFLRNRYSEFACMHGTWDHRNEQWNAKANVAYKCDTLLSVYPVIHRDCMKNGGVRETLKLGEEILHTFEMTEEKCPSDTEPFSLQ